MDLVKGAARLRAELDKRNRLRANLKELPEEFRKRYHAWCLDECQAECARDFQLVRLVRNSEVSVFLEYAGALQSDLERSQLVAALSKRLRSEVLTAAQLEIVDRYLRYFEVPFTHPSGQILMSQRVTAEDQALGERFHPYRNKKTEIARALSAGLKRAAQGDCGRVIVNRPAGLWLEAPIHDLFVVTAFEFAGWSQLRYVQTVHASPGGQHGTSISTGISVLHWMGISTSTTFTNLVPDDVPDAVRDVARLCVHFIRAAEALLKGLKPS